MTVHCCATAGRSHAKFHSNRTFCTAVTWIRGVLFCAQTLWGHPHALTLTSLCGMNGGGSSTSNGHPRVNRAETQYFECLVAAGWPPLENGDLEGDSWLLKYWGSRVLRRGGAMVGPYMMEAM